MLYTNPSLSSGPILRVRSIISVLPYMVHARCASMVTLSDVISLFILRFICC